MVKKLHIQKLLILIVILFFGEKSFAQTISSTTYPRTVSSGASLVSYTSLGTLIGSGRDDTNSSLANIGFDFWFNGVRYTEFGVSANGYLSLGSAPSATGTLSYINNLSNGADVPKIASFWSDLTTGSDGYVRYGLNGTAPNRTLVVEWKTNLYNGGGTSSSAGMTFQAILSETTGKIQYIYGSGMLTLTGYSVGFSAAGINTVSMATATNVASYGSDPNNSQTTAIASGKSYVFIPLVPIAPTGLTFTNVTANSIDLNWTDNASNEVGYVIYSSTDNINFTFNQQVTANSTTANVIGLSSGILYYFRVYAVTEGCLSSPVLTGSQTTLSQVILTTSGTWVAPACVTAITVETWGAGGGGGSSSNDNKAGGSGGGGGAYAKGNHTVVPGSTYYYAVGSGGTGGPANSTTAASSGSSSWFNATALTNSAPANNVSGTLAMGGGSGVNNTSSNPTNGGLATSCFGNSTTASGSNGFGGYNKGGGTGGDGASPGGGAGGSGSSSTNGSNGTSPGGGGGGSNDNKNNKGGNGGLGQVLITYTYQVAVPSGIPIVNGPICAGSTSITGMSSEANGTTIEIFKASVSLGTTTVNSGTWTKTGLGALSAGDLISAKATAACKTVSLSSTIVTVNSSTIITLTKTDKTCSAINDGTINTTLSGGLSNIRYIKLTQKYVNSEAWQQVQEIQAFEMFTNTNVALSSNGAAATSSSNYNNNPVSYGPLKAIDGDATGYSFWHSNSVNIDEWIKVDLQSGKNLDYLRIYNRSDCCWSRGQNMLLELFDASNNVVYSKTVNLWGGVNGANFIDINVLDLVWSDGGTTLNRTGLNDGTYTLNVNDVLGCNSSKSIAVNNAVINTWTGSWSNGTPTISQKLVFSSNYSNINDVDIEGCSCKVTGVATVVTIKSGRTLKIINEVEVQPNASLVFENSASLVQENGGAINSGNITYKRETNTIVRNTDYTYWSTPVSPLKLAGTGGISYNPSNLAGSIFYSYLVNATSEGWKSESATTTMKVGEGYIIRGPLAISANPPSSLQATFVGVPNNGDVSITINKKDASYLLGNPYPSAIDADTFLGINSAVLNGTLYFWTHNTAIQNRTNIALTAGTGAYAYTSDDYASYNLTGGVGIEKGVKASSDLDSAPIIPRGKIGAGQGFIASTYKATGSIVFNNSMRVSGTSGNNAQFFKVSSVKGKATATIEKNRIWLDLYNEQGAFKQTLLGYVNGATNDIDSAYDGETTDGQEFIDFYSVNQDKNLVIQGRALPFNEADEVPLGYRTAIDGNFTISIEQTEGVFTSQSVFLEDKLTNTIADLNSGNYTFNTAIGTFNDRFVLRYTNKTLGLGDIDSIEKGIYVSSKNKQIKINSTIEAINNIQIYDLSGKLIYQKTKIDSNELVISNLMSAHQVLLVKVSLLDGSLVTKKLIY
ncbi:T9SS sorting signal type C domain-containing protein [Flavobacterium frigoris]|uniref:F5/8 type C domain-containing protein n=1 Tax=Flavobacterium frigoris TaxID=229204 RepID=A0A1H9BXD1_FLAFI|nr:T9SS sorting signal type C domain-containing protein [Flavobacterium frigoris]SEP93590.1 F5/8 type C domain-containing protein [Flavobacterium frigoris]